MAGFVAKYQIAILVSRIRPVLNPTEFEIGDSQARFFFDLADDRGNNTLATFDMATRKRDSRLLFRFPILDQHPLTVGNHAHIG